MFYTLGVWLRNTPFDSLVQTGQLANVFAMCLAPQGGVITLVRIGLTHEHLSDPSSQREVLTRCCTQVLSNGRLSRLRYTLTFLLSYAYPNITCTRRCGMC